MLRADPSSRIGGALIAIALQAGILCALFFGLALRVPEVVRDPLTLFVTAPPPPPPPPVVPPKHRTKGHVGAAAPANRKSTATEVQAPKPVVPPVKPPPIVAAPTLNVGVQATQGAAPVAGPGSGAGGTGNGTGSGGQGDGDGGGDDTPPRQIGGRMRIDDLPPDLMAMGIRGTVGVRYAVEVNGAVDDCRVTRSSGNRELDALTCRLIETRFRYRPSLDGDGHPVKAYVVENHSWEVTGDDTGRR